MLAHQFYNNQDILMNNLTQTDLWQLRALVQKSGWGEFMSHIAGLMAEQADKVLPGSEQDHNLFQCSNTINALRPFFIKCGYFDYSQHTSMLPDQAAIDILKRYPPPSAHKDG